MLHTRRSVALTPKCSSGQATDERQPNQEDQTRPPASVGDPDRRDRRFTTPASAKDRLHQVRPRLFCAADLPIDAVRRLVDGGRLLDRDVTEALERRLGGAQ